MTAKQLAQMHAILKEHAGDEDTTLYAVRAGNFFGALEREVLRLWAKNATLRATVQTLKHRAAVLEDNLR